MDSNGFSTKTDIIFLDEPTTYLDISHQLEILELVQHLNKELGCTIVMVLHDINQAIRFSDYLLIMKEGHIIDNGPTDQVLSKEILESVFNIDAVLGKDPRTGKPLLVTYNLLEKDKIDYNFSNIATIIMMLDTYLSHF